MRGIPRRSRLETLMDILEVASKKPIIMVHLLYKTNLCYVTLKAYIAFLKSKGLVEEICAERKYFRTTDKGLKVLGLYRMIKEELL